MKLINDETDIFPDDFCRTCANCRPQLLLPSDMGCCCEELDLSISPQEANGPCSYYRSIASCYGRGGK